MQESRRGAYGRMGGRGADNTPQVRSAMGKRILVIEDSPSARKLIQGLLLRLGVSLPDLRLAETADAALRVFTAWDPQVAIVDLQLRPPAGAPSGGTGRADASMNGAELALQMIQRNPALKVIICSASEPEHTALKPLVASGRVLSMMKPVLASNLAEVLERATEGSAGPPRGR